MTSDDNQKCNKNTVKEIGIPVFSLNQTQEAPLKNCNILSAFNRNLGEAMESQKGSPLDHGSEFRHIAWITKLFSHHEDKDIIVYIIQKGLPYHLSPIEEATIKSDLENMLLRRKHKSAKAYLNATALGK